MLYLLCVRGKTSETHTVIQLTRLRSAYPLQRRVGAFEVKMRILHELLNEADSLFPTRKRVKIDQLSYSLQRYQRGLWSFCVTDNWIKWSNAGYKYNFGLYETPEPAVLEFLNYVKANKINVKKLAKE